MVSDAREQFVIIGSGPAALACALLRAQRGPVRLLMPRSPQLIANTNGRVEVVPSETLALLVELGIPPSTIGVEQLHRHRLVAWRSREPVLSSTPAAAHLLRPALERAILKRVLQVPYIAVRSIERSSIVAAVEHYAQKGMRVIDASGRKSALGQGIVHPPSPWVARLFKVETPVPECDEVFRLATLPDGYVYRAGNRQCTTVGIVGRNALLRGAIDTLRTRLAGGPAAWVVEDLPHCRWTASGSCVASVQWSVPCGFVQIGDAAFAHDALASQGIANGLSDACHAAAIYSETDATRVRARIWHAHSAHLHSLASAIKDCCWREEPAWSSYLSFLCSAQISPAQTATVAVRNGRLHDLDRATVLLSAANTLEDVH